MVALTGHREAYYSDYRGHPGEFIAAAKHGFLYQGQRYQWQQKSRGTPTLDLPAECFVIFLQNHDQIANSGTGERCHALTSPGRLRAMTAYLLLMPGIPMLFQGQEFAASTPFFYFADPCNELSRSVREGRRTFLAHFPSLATSQMQATLTDPGDIETFRRSVLDLGERQRHASIYALHRDLLALRRTDPVLGQRPCRIDGAALTEEAWGLRFFSEDGVDRLLIVNLGRDLLLGPTPEPLLAPVEGQAWQILWSSESPIYGGSGDPVQDEHGDWLISGQSAAVLAPGPVVAPIEAKKVYKLGAANG
jgi:maltooligosyltrehalose trehalohydrolase